MRPIAVTGPKRTLSLPDVPTVGESLRPTSPAPLLGATHPRRHAAAVVKQLNADVLKAMQVTDVRSALPKWIWSRSHHTAQCDAFLREQVAVWGNIVKASGARGGLTALTATAKRSP